MKKALALVLLTIVICTTVVSLAEDIKLYLYPTGEVEVNISRTYTQNVTSEYEGYLKLDFLLDITQVNRATIDLELESSINPTITGLEIKNRTVGSIDLDADIKSAESKSSIAMDLTLDFETEEVPIFSLTMLANTEQYINGTIFIEGNASITLSSKVLSPTQIAMIVAMLNKETINNMLKAQGINYLELKELQINLETSEETYDIEALFSMVMDINRYATWAEEKGIANASKIIENYRRTFVNLKASISMSTDFEAIEYDTHKHYKALNITASLYAEIEGEISKVIESYRETLESSKAIGVPSAPQLTLPPELEKRLEESKEFLDKVSSEIEKIEIAPSKIQLKIDAKAQEGISTIELSLTGLKLKAKDKEGVEGLREVLSALKEIMININELSEKELKKPLLPSTVDLIGKASEGKIIKVAQTRVSIEELDSIAIQSEEFTPTTPTTPTPTTTPTTPTTPVTPTAPAMPTTMIIAIGVAIIVIIAIAIIILKLRGRSS